MITLMLSCIAYTPASDAHTLDLLKREDGAYVVRTGTRNVAVCSEVDDAISVFRTHQETRLAAMAKHERGE